MPEDISLLFYLCFFDKKVKLSVYTILKMRNVRNFLVMIYSFLKPVQNSAIAFFALNQFPSHRSIIFQTILFISVAHILMLRGQGVPDHGMVKIYFFGVFDRGASYLPGIFTE